MVISRDGSGTPYKSNIKNVAVKTDFYSVEGPENELDEVEKLFSTIEGQAATAIDDLIAGKYDGRGLLDELAMFVALQWTRSPHHRRGYELLEAQLERFRMMNIPREQIRAIVEEAEAKPISEDQLDELIAHTSNPQNIEVDVHRNNWVKELLANLPSTADTLLGRPWMLVRAQEGEFICSDAPVSLWTKDLHPFWSYGIGTADEVTCPLGREHALVIHWNTQIPAGARSISQPQVTRVNEQTAFAAVQWLFHHPDTTPTAGMRFPHSPSGFVLDFKRHRIVD